MNLLPCPFCGETKRLVVYTQEYNGYYHSAQVDCENDDCLASGPTILAPSKTQHDGLLKQQAVEGWNRRAPSLFGRPIIETSELVTGPIVFGGPIIGELVNDDFITGADLASFVTAHLKDWDWPDNEV